MDYATVALGLYAAANGIPRAKILEIDDLVARTSHFKEGTPFDTRYKHLPTRNIENTDLGYSLYKSYIDGLNDKSEGSPGPSR